MAVSAILREIGIVGEAVNALPEGPNQIPWPLRRR